MSLVYTYRRAQNSGPARPHPASKNTLRHDHPRPSSNEKIDSAPYANPPRKCSVFSSPLCPVLGELRPVVPASTALFSAPLRACGSTAAIWTCRDDIQSAQAGLHKANGRFPMCPTVPTSVCPGRYQYLQQLHFAAVRCGISTSNCQRSVPSQRFLANDRIHHLATTFCAGAFVNISVIDPPGLCGHGPGRELTL
jgi:hypothetical protein